PPPASSKNASSTAMAALIACTRSSLPSPPFPGAYQNEKVRPMILWAGKKLAGFVPKDRIQCVRSKATGMQL
ncbi:MAG: hypothetical protein ACLQVX_00925, partial [Limisphaerales bacterium]